MFNFRNIPKQINFQFPMFSLRFSLKITEDLNLVSTSHTLYFCFQFLMNHHQKSHISGCYLLSFLHNLPALCYRHQLHFHSSFIFFLAWKFHIFSSSQVNVQIYKTPRAGCLFSSFSILSLFHALSICCLFTFYLFSLSFFF